MRFIASAQDWQKVHSYEQIKATPVNGVSAVHFSHCGFIFSISHPAQSSATRRRVISRTAIFQLSERTKRTPYKGTYATRAKSRDDRPNTSAHRCDRRYAPPASRRHKADQGTIQAMRPASQRRDFFLAYAGRPLVTALQAGPDSSLTVNPCHQKKLTKDHKLPLP